MKIIMSRNLVKHTDDLRNEIMRQVCTAADLPQTELPSGIDQAIELSQATVTLKHFNVKVDEEAVTYEISDEFVISALHIYDRVAKIVGAVIVFVKPLTALLKTDVIDLYTMATETK